MRWGIILDKSSKCTTILGLAGLFFQTQCKQSNGFWWGMLRIRWMGKNAVPYTPGCAKAGRSCCGGKFVYEFQFVYGTARTTSWCSEGNEHQRQAVQKGWYMPGNWSKSDSPSLFQTRIEDEEGLFICFDIKRIRKGKRKRATNMHAQTSPPTPPQ